MNKNNLPEILVIGLPNSGKSTLVNALTHQKTSIIGSTPNTTRDKVSKTIKFDDNKKIIISDLPGFLEAPDSVNKKYQENINKYIFNAKIIFFVIDVNTNDFVGLDAIFNLLTKNKLNQKVVTIFNKSENFNKANLDNRMYKYILEFEIYISAYHKINLEPLIDFLRKEAVHESTISNSNLSITIIGRPNAGKSTLFNSLLNKERSTVSEIPGTTRDKIDEKIFFNSREYTITDTAGIPRKKQKNQIDRYSSVVSINALKDANIAILVVDSQEGLSFEDKRILKLSLESTVTPILILNKWDVINTEKRNAINKNIKTELKQYEWITVIRTSALSGKNIHQISNAISVIEEQLQTRIATSDLNSTFRAVWTKTPPHPFRGKRAKLKYVTQYANNPPEFSFNLSARIPQNYYAFIENTIRSKYNFQSVAIKIKVNV